jgi:beta-mannosidase
MSLDVHFSKEYTQRWIVNDNWTYTADLTPFQQGYKNDPSDRTLLVFYGIDTIANIVRDLLL